MSASVRDSLARLGEAAWELRRGAYARGWRRPRKVAAHVVSIGNLSVGGTGKTTLTQHLAARSAAEGTRTAVVLRRYRPGPDGFGDEERLLESALPGVAIHAGTHKLALAEEAVARGAERILVDDGFSHWALARDVEIVLVDARADLARARMLPGGFLREPWRALQRADFVVASRLDPGEDGAALLRFLARHAPGAKLAAGRHAVTGARTLAGAPLAREGRVRVVTGTGNPESVARTASEAGFEVAALAVYRDHHAFTEAEAARELAAAERAGVRVLLTAKDAVRWPEAAAAGVAVLEVAWEWVSGGEAVERAVLGGREA